MRLTSGVCVVYYELPGGTAFLMRRVRRRIDQPPLTHIIRATCLKFFDHTARADPSVDHSRALHKASMASLPRDRNRRSGRPHHTWLQTTESDLAPLNIGLVTAYH